MAAQTTALFVMMLLQRVMLLNLTSLQIQVKSVNRSLWQRQEVETGITKSNRQNSCSCWIFKICHCTVLISIHTEMQKIILFDLSAQFLKESSPT